MAGEEDLENSSPSYSRRPTACSNTFLPAFDTAATTADALCSRSQGLRSGGTAGGGARDKFQAASYSHRQQVSQQQQQGRARQTLAEVLRVSGGAAVPSSIAELLMEDQPRLPGTTCHVSSHELSERSEHDLGQPIALSHAAVRTPGGNAQLSPVGYFFRPWSSLSTQ